MTKRIGGNPQSSLFSVQNKVSHPQRMQSNRFHVLVDQKRFAIFAANKMVFMKFIDNYIQQIAALCKKHRVKSLYAFGSVLTPKFNADSDIDLLVDFNAIAAEDYFENYCSLKESLETIFQREVDLVEDKGIRNNVFRRVVDRTKQIIYG